MSTNVKVYFQNGEIRRFQVELGFRPFYNVITKAFEFLKEKTLNTENIQVLYQDEDGDWINCDKEEEFKECIRVSKGYLKLKIFFPGQSFFQRTIQESIKEEPKKEPVKEQPKPESIKEEPKKVTHCGVTCDKCHKEDIQGNRMKCLQCKNYDLCEDCYKSKNSFHPYHSFQIISEPEQVIEKVVQVIEKPKKAIHVNVCCDGCYTNPIVGTRYMCLNCNNNSFDLCEKCFTKRKELHYSNHVFRALEEPMSQQSFIQPPIHKEPIIVPMQHMITKK